MAYSGTATQKPSKSRSAPPLSSISSRLEGIHIDEEVKIAVSLCLERFSYSDENEVEFPSSFTRTERAFVHQMARSLGYISKSKGKKTNRFLTVRKRASSDKPGPAMVLTVSHNSLHFIRSLLQRFPISNKGRINMQPNSRSGTSVAAEA
ncbi:3'-5' RNA helicase YTHDC2-like, partial [Plectropomus leopardus]|uniref:3'-5' RNA helicase YTHDC2-like n=1 Tax=Plectropomus leopardus TaxID=160734 RepID=UPI001C4CC7EA